MKCDQINTWLKIASFEVMKLNLARKFNKNADGQAFDSKIG